MKKKGDTTMEIYEKIINILKDLGIDDAEKIDRDAELADVLDSLVFVKLLIDVDKKLGISIADEDINFETFHSINAIVAYVEQKLAEQ